MSISQAEDLINELNADAAIATKLFTKKDSTFKPWLESTAIKTCCGFFCVHCGEHVQKLQGHLVNLNNRADASYYQTTGYRCGKCEDSVYEMAQNHAFNLLQLHCNTNVEVQSFDKIEPAIAAIIMGKMIENSGISFNADGYKRFEMLILKPDNYVFHMHRRAHCNFDFKVGLKHRQEHKYYSDDPIHNFYLLVGKKFIELKEQSKVLVENEIEQLKNRLDKINNTAINEELIPKK